MLVQLRVLVLEVVSLVNSLGVVYTILLRRMTSAFTAITNDGITGIKTGPSNH